MACSPTDIPSARAARRRFYNHNRHPYWTLLVGVLLLAGAALNCAAFLFSSYITTTRLVPFFDDQLVQDVGGADAFAQLPWRVDTRVGALVICHTIVSPKQWASPEKCFAYHTASLVLTHAGEKPQPFPSACGMLQMNRTMDTTVTNLLHSVCAVPGLLVATLPNAAGLIAILSAAAAARTLFASSARHVRWLHRLSWMAATLSALLVLVAYLIWTSLLSAGLDMRQALSAQLTVASLGAWVVAAAVALALVRAEVEGRETLRPVDAMAA